MDSSRALSADTFTSAPKQSGPEMHDSNNNPMSLIMNSFPVNKTQLFMSGYADCANVALRFLLEEVGLCFSNHLVLGLYQHLSDHEKLIHVQHLLKLANLYDEPDKTTESKEEQTEAGEDQNEANEDRSSSEDAGEVIESDTGVTDPEPEENDKLVTELAKYLKIPCTLKVDDDSEDDESRVEGFAD